MPDQKLFDECARLCGNDQNAINLYLVVKGARKSSLLSLGHMIRETDAYLRVFGKMQKEFDERLSRYEKNIDMKDFFRMREVRSFSSDHRWLGLLQEFCERHGVLMITESRFFEVLVTRSNRLDDVVQFVMYSEHREESFRALARLLEYPQLTSKEYHTFMHDGQRALPNSSVQIEVSDGSKVYLASFAHTRNRAHARSMSASKIEGATRGLRLAEGRVVSRCVKSLT